MSGVTSLPLPRYLVESAAADASPERREWVAALPEIVAALAERWSLRLGEPYRPGGQCSWVALAVDACGQHLVLKVGWRHSEALHEADALRLWAGDGAALLHDAHTFGQTSALLMELCSPGAPLKHAVAEPEQDLVVAGLLNRLWREPEAVHPFRSLQSMCEDWAAEFGAKLAARPDAVDPGLARAGMELFRFLPATADRSVVLVTDLHAENILASQREPWLVIDPKPYVGDPAYDSLQHMLNCESRLQANPVVLVQRMAELLPVDPERLRSWLFARCVQESLDQPHPSLALPHAIHACTRCVSDGAAAARESDGSAPGRRNGARPGHCPSPCRRASRSRTRSSCHSAGRVRVNTSLRVLRRGRAWTGGRCEAQSSRPSLVRRGRGRASPLRRRPALSPDWRGTA